MRRIAHLSDLHFGAVEPEVAEGLLADLATLNPALVAVSGDLTQRARSHEFRAARSFLTRAGRPLVVVPGNHDIPLFDLGRRLLRPLVRYKRYVSPELAPEYFDEEIAVFGINTARTLTWKGGRISREQIEHLRRRACGASESLFKVAVTHHPFVLPEGAPHRWLLGRAERALKAIEECGVGLLLAGHLHVSYSGHTGVQYSALERHILIAQAGTAMSKRRRHGEANAYNLVTVDPPRVRIEVRAWQGERFDTHEDSTFELADGLWRLTARGA